MKRRTIDPSKLRRPLKRSRITESIYGSVFLYVRFFLVWIMVLTADFLLEFRFEYLWPFWLLLRSAYDSFKYQGLAFSLLFLTLAFCSDLVCLMLLPVHWLFFAASTYVWVQFVWHTDRGLCLPTVSLWLLFVYVEASVRLRELKNLPFHLDLCRPFAAHCIGYPVVTLGYGVKSYVGYKMRQRKMQKVAKENEFYMQLINEALPSEVNSSGDGTEKTSKALCNGQTPHGEVHIPRSRLLPILTNGINTKTDLELLLAQEASRRGLKLSDIESTTKVKGNHSLLNSLNSYPSKKSSEDHNLNELDKLSPDGETEKASKAPSNRSVFFSCGKSSRKVSANGRAGEKGKYYEEEDGEGSDSDSLSASSSSFSSRKNSRSNSPKQGHDKGHAGDGSPSLFSQLKEEKASRRRAEAFAGQLENSVTQFECDNKRLKVELQASRQCELELRSSMNSLMANERSAKIELQQLKAEHDTLRQKYQTLNTAKQQDRNTISSLERKWKTERDSRLLCETQLRDERRKQKADEVAQKQRDDAGRHEPCVARRTELEDETRQLRSLLQEKEENLKRLTVENELFKKKHKENDGLQLKKETEVLMSALTAMQGKNTHLENSLSSETRLKLDLFSALGDTRRQLEIAQGKLASKDKEVEALKAKIAEVMAVMPATSYPNMSPTCQDVSGLTCLNPTAPCYVPAIKKNGML